MERLGKEAIILTKEEFETIRRYKKIERLAEEEKAEEESNNKQQLDINIALIVIIAIPIIAFIIANFSIMYKIYELLEKTNIIT